MWHRSRLFPQEVCAPVALPSDDSGLPGKRQKAFIGRQEFEKPVGIVPIVQRVREIERKIASDELKLFCHGLPLPL